MQINTNWLKAVKDNNQPLFFILGLCSLENEPHTLKVAENLVNLSQKLKFHLIFKASFDKANRISLKSYRSVGLDNGLKILQKVRQTFQVPVITDVHECAQVKPVSEVVDVIQIPAFLCRQTDLLTAAGNTGKPVFAKKGQYLNPEAVGSIIEKVVSTGNESIWVGERGYTFGYNNLIVDFRSFPIMKSFGKPVVFDVTHAVQRPGGLGDSTGGNREFVAALATAAVSLGLAGMFMEVHEEPERALSDGPNTVRLSQLPDLISYLMELDAWVKSRPQPKIW